MAIAPSRGISKYFKIKERMYLRFLKTYTQGTELENLPCQGVHVVCVKLLPAKFINKVDSKSGLFFLSYNNSYEEASRAREISLD